MLGLFKLSASPTTEIGASLAVRIADAVGAARGEYRRAVEAEVAGRKLSAKSVETLAAAMQTLGLGQPEFDADFETARELAGLKAQEARFGELAQEQPARERRMAEINDLIEKLRREHATLSGQIYQTSSMQGTLSGQIHGIVARKSWLFA